MMKNLSHNCCGAASLLPEFGRRTLEAHRNSQTLLAPLGAEKVPIEKTTWINDKAEFLQATLTTQRLNVHVQI